MSQVAAGGIAVTDGRRASSSPSASALLAGFALALVALTQAPSAGAEEVVERSAQQDFRVATLAGGLDHPWSPAFLPDGALLTTVRPGRPRLLQDGDLLEEPVTGLPRGAGRGPGGLFADANEGMEGKR